MTTTTKYVWTVKSNSEVGSWTPAKTLAGAMRAARLAAGNVVVATRAEVAIDHGNGELQIVKRFGWYQISATDTWQDAQ